MGDSSGEVCLVHLLNSLLLTAHHRARVGVDAMLHLLTETSIFISLPNQCLCQMTGEPLIHIVPSNSGTLLKVSEPISARASNILVKPSAKRKAPGNHEDERPTKRLRVHESVASISTTGATGKFAAQPTIKYVS